MGILTRLFPFPNSNTLETSIMGRLDSGSVDSSFTTDRSRPQSLPHVTLTESLTVFFPDLRPRLTVTDLHPDNNPLRVPLSSFPSVFGEEEGGRTVRDRVRGGPSRFVPRRPFCLYSTRLRVGIIVSRLISFSPKL